MSDERPQGPSMALLGIGLGLATACVVGGLVGLGIAHRVRTEGRKGWNLVPVVVAASDAPAGTVMSFEMISQRSLPEQFVSSSVVKPDSASYIVNQRLLVGARAGDLMLWSSFEQAASTDCVALGDSIVRKRSAPPSPALSQLLGAMRAGKDKP